MLLQVGLERAEQEVVQFLDFDREHVRHAGDWQVPIARTAVILVAVGRLRPSSLLLGLLGGEGFVEHGAGAEGERIVAEEGRKETARTHCRL